MNLEVIKSIWRRIKKPSRKTIEQISSEHKHKFEADGECCLTCGKTVVQLIGADYEPEQAWGTHHDLNEHLHYGGTLDEY